VCVPPGTKDVPGRRIDSLATKRHKIHQEWQLPAAFSGSTNNSIHDFESQRPPEFHASFKVCISLPYLVNSVSLRGQQKNVKSGSGIAGGYRYVGDDGATQTVFNDNDIDTVVSGAAPPVDARYCVCTLTSVPDSRHLASLLDANLCVTLTGAAPVGDHRLLSGILTG
jgi:hypothetical protein